MKIGIDCHNIEEQRTGVGRYLWNLLREWTGFDFQPYTHDREYMVEFFLYFKSEIPKDIRMLLEYSRGRENCIKQWKSCVLGCKSNAIFKHWFLPRAAARDKIDVLFCPDYILPLSLSFFRFFTKNLLSQKVCVKTAVTIHDIMYEARPAEYSWPSWKDKILLKWASKQSAKKGDVIFVPSEFTKREILKYYQVNSAKIVVTPLAPDPIFRPYSHDRGNMIGEEVKRKYGIYSKYIFFVGSIFNRRFLPQKIRAFTEFGKNFPGYQFLIIGQNRTKPFVDIGMLVLAANRELHREAVVWKEWASDEELVYLYNDAFVTLWLSSYEGFGLPVLESMACGTPVITSMKGSLPEIAGDAAMYVARPENSEEISNALTHLAHYNSYYNELAAKGLARAARFSFQKCAEATLTNLMKLIR